MKKSMLSGLLALLMFASFSVWSATDQKPLAGEKLVVFIKSGDVTESGMGLALAHSAVKKGAKVTVVLGANAAWFPARFGGQGIFAAKGKTPREMLQTIISDGGTVFLCGLCAEFHQLKEEHLIEGVKIVKSIKIWERLFEDNARSMYF